MASDNTLNILNKRLRDHEQGIDVLDREQLAYLLLDIHERKQIVEAYYQNISRIMADDMTGQDLDAFHGNC